MVTHFSMTQSDDYDLKDFTPYLLNLAAETTSLAFQPHYKDRYGMLRAEWRVLFHLGRYGPMTARDICDRARLHKTKVSRAVAALEDKRYLSRHQKAADKRQEELRLTKQGARAFQALYAEARTFDAKLIGQFDEAEQAVLRRCLSQLAQL